MKITQFNLKIKRQKNSIEYVSVYNFDASASYPTPVIIKDASMLFPSCLSPPSLYLSLSLFTFFVFAVVWSSPHQNIHWVEYNNVPLGTENNNA
jgi:hypothetical protein